MWWTRYRLEEVPFIYPPQEALSSEMRNRTKLMYGDPEVFENDKNTALLQEIRKHGFTQFDFQVGGNFLNSTVPSTILFGHVYCLLVDVS